MFAKIIKYLCDWEEYREKPYYATPYEQSKNILTLGYGFKYSKNDINVNRISERSALRFLTKKIIDLQSKLSLPPYSQTDDKTNWMNDALIALAYNMGPSGFPELLRALHEGDNARALNEFYNGIYQAKMPLEGLIYRRACDAQIFEKGIYEKRDYITPIEKQRFLDMNQTSKETIDMINSKVKVK